MKDISENSCRIVTNDTMIAILSLLDTRRIRDWNKEIIMNH